MATELARYQEGDCFDYTPTAATTSGTAVQLPDGTVGTPPSDIAASAKGSIQCKGVFKVAAATGTTWSDGDELWFDDSAGEAVVKSNALDGSADFRLGLAYGDKASGPLYGYVRLNEVRPPFDPIVYEFDVADGDTDSHVLIPAEMNPHGLVITSIFGIVTEAMVGSSEDQAVITVSDESDNSLATLTPSDAAADDIGDLVEGWFLHEQATGTAGVTVAAGEYVDAAVTTQTSGGTPAGKIKVYITAIPLK